MIEPFVDRQTRDGCISYGLSSYGYDARVSDDFKIFTNVDSAVVDPKNFAHNSFVDRKGPVRSEEHTSELQSLMRISYAVFCLKKKKHTSYITIKSKPQLQITKTKPRVRTINV